MQSLTHSGPVHGGCVGGIATVVAVASAVAVAVAVVVNVVVSVDVADREEELLLRAASHMASTAASARNDACA